GEAEPELRGDRCGVAHAVDREPEQDHLRLPLVDQQLERVLVDVVLELRPVDAYVDHLVDALAVHVERVGTDHGDGDWAAERARSRHELEGHIADAPLQLLGDHQNAQAAPVRTSHVRALTPDMAKRDAPLTRAALARAPGSAAPGLPDRRSAARRP